MKRIAQTAVSVVTACILGLLYLHNWDSPHTRSSNVPDLPPGPQVGEMAPIFILPDTHGKSTSLAVFRGRRTVLAFFCGCDRCHKAAQKITLLQKAGKIKYFVAVIAEIPMAATQFQKDTGFKGTVLSDQDQKAENIYQASFCPRICVIAPDGKLVYLSGLALEDKALDDALKTTQTL